MSENQRKIFLNEKGANFEETTLCIEVPKWMQLPKPSDLNHFFLVILLSERDTEI